MTPRLATLALASALVVIAAAPAPASTISGRLTDAKLPAKGKGIATVRAISPKTFAIVAAKRVSGGRFSLSLPAGAYFMLGTSTPFRGGTAVDRSVGTVKVAKGARKTVKLSLKPAKRTTPKLPKIPGLPNFPTARAAFVNVDHPAVWIKHYTVNSADPDFKVLGRGLFQMLVTDVLPGLKAACRGAIVEREKFNVILAEHALSQSSLADPSLRLDASKIIGHNKEVTGTITGSGTNLSITTTVKDVISGRSRSFTHSGTDGFFALEPKLVPDLIRLLCGDKPPVRYVGTIRGESGIPEQMLRWSGSVRLKDNGLGPGGPGTPDGKYRTYVVEDGSLHVTLDGVDGPQRECTIHGEADIALVANLGEFATLQLDVESPAYTLEASFPNGTNMQYASTGPSPSCIGGRFPLSGRVYMNTQGAQVSPAFSLIGSVTVNVGISVTWSWSLEPQY